MLSLKTHNVIDYVVGVLLILVPFIFGLSDIAAARNFFVLGGAALIVYSLLTNYYYAVVRVIPLGAHMVLDAILGVATILAPVLFGYRDQITGGQYALHVILGLAAIGLVAVTKPRTEAAKSPAERAEIAHDAPLRT